MAKRATFLTLLALVLAQAVHAQEAPPAPAKETVDVSRLPINLERIQRQLSQPQDRVAREGLNIRYMIDVYGQAPPLILFGPEDNLVNGPVPYGAPTHKEMIEQVTPQEYRAPAADLGALFRWLSDRTKK